MAKFGLNEHLLRSYSLCRKWDGQELFLGCGAFLEVKTLLMSIVIANLIL